MSTQPNQPHSSFVITTSRKGNSHDRLWESENPVVLGPTLPWLLERTDQGVRIRNIALSGAGSSLNQALKIDVPWDQLEEDRTIDLPNLTGGSEPGTSVRISRVRPLPAPYGEVSSGSLAKDSQAELYVFCGVLDAVASVQQVPGHFIAFAGKQKIFTLKKESGVCKIKFLREGLKVKLSGKEVVEVKANQLLEMSFSELAGSTISLGRDWWKLSFVQLPKSLATLQDISDLKDPELKTLKRVFAVTLILALSLGAISGLLREKPEVLPEVKSVRLQKKTLIMGEIKVKPKPVVPVSPPPAPLVLAPTNNPAQSTAPQVAQKPQAAKPDAASFLRNAFSGAFKLSKNKPAEGKVEKLSQAAGGANLFKSAASAAVGKLDAKLAAVSPSTTVQIAGTKSGYSGVAQAAKATGNGSFIPLDTAPAMAEEGLSKDEVGSVIHSHMTEVRYCHEMSLVSNPKTEGRLLLSFSINAQGAVEGIKTESTSLPKGKLEECVIGKLGKWQFPKPKKGAKVAVSYPFIFKTLAGE